MELSSIIKSAVAVTKADELAITSWLGEDGNRYKLLDLWARRVLGGSATRETLEGLIQGNSTIQPFEGNLTTVQRALSSNGGPGTELKKILSGLGFLPDNCSCNTRMLTMDAWGLDGCRKNYNAILGWLREEQANRGWLARAKAGVLAVTSGMIMKVNPLDPAPGLLDEAIRRWEQIVGHNHDVREMAKQRPPQQEGLRPYVLHRNGGGHEQNLIEPATTSHFHEGSLTSLKWAYGVTTVVQRRDDLLPRTLASLKNAGFPEPTLFVDGCTLEEARSYETKFNLPVEFHRRNIKTYGNWFLALAELYIRHPACDRYAVFQDDFITYKNLRRYLELCKYPDPNTKQGNPGPVQLGKPKPGFQRGYWNLYTFPSNQMIAPADKYGKQRTGWYESNQLGKGAVALVFSRDCVSILLRSTHMIERIQTPGRGSVAVDGGVVTALAKEGWKEYVHNPSLVQHTGFVTSMGNPVQLLAESFQGEEFDALSLLPAEVLSPTPSSTTQDQQYQAQIRDG